MGTWENYEDREDDDNEGSQTFQSKYYSDSHYYILRVLTGSCGFTQLACLFSTFFNQTVFVRYVVGRRDEMTGEKIVGFTV